MDGIHDMGGMDGFGKVRPEKNEPVFHDAWEGRCLALNRAMGYAGIWTIDETRAGIEELPPDIYLTSSYYKKWALRLENLVVERGLADADEVQAGHALRPGKTLKRKLSAADVPNTLSRGSYGRPGPASSPAIACAPKISIRQRIPACRATPATASASSRPCAAATSIRMRSPSATARTRNGSTPCCSRAANCGATTPIRR
jgi:nitrile hydratase subunit beta